MHRIDHPTAQEGRFFAGDKSTGVPATTVTAAIMNDIMCNLCSTIEGAGLTLEKGNENQLLQAIQAIAAASVPIVIDYELAATHSVPVPGPTRLNFATKIKDTNNVVTVGASWNAVIPVAGYYLMLAKLKISGWSTNLGLGFLDVYVNGASQFTAGEHVRSLCEIAQNSGGVTYLNGSLVRYFAQGDVVDFRFYNGSGASRDITNAKIQMIKMG